MAEQQAVQAAIAEQHLVMGYEEFLALPDDLHAEWVNGEVTIFMPPTTLHQRLVSFLAKILGLYAQALRLGEVLVAPCEMRLAHSAREPDLLFVATENLGRISPQRIEGPADLVIELISPESVARDRADKFYEYQEAGVREYWIIDPRPGKERVDWYALAADQTFLSIVPDAAGRYVSQVLPGFWLRPQWLWRVTLPAPVTVIKTINPQAWEIITTSDDPTL